MPAKDPEPSRNCCGSFWRRLVLFVAFLLVAGGLLFAFRTPILTGLASAWIVDDPVDKADAIVVLGGGVQTRPFKAAELYRNGFADKILIMNVEPSPTTQIKLTPVEADMTRLILEKEGVPTTAIAVTTRQVSSTFDETLAVKEWATSNQVQNLIIPTSLFHTRRVKWVFARTFKGTDVKLRVVAIPERKFSHRTWWKHEEGIVSFHSEILKMLYYMVKY